jgi:hypothetical protein
MSSLTRASRAVQYSILEAARGEQLRREIEMEAVTLWESYQISAARCGAISEDGSCPSCSPPQCRHTSTVAE